MTENNKDNQNDVINAPEQPEPSKIQQLIWMRVELREKVSLNSAVLKNSNPRNPKRGEYQETIARHKFELGVLDSQIYVENMKQSLTEFFDESNEVIAGVIEKIFGNKKEVVKIPVAKSIVLVEERQLVMNALRKAAWNKKKAAEYLKMSVTTLNRRMIKFKIGPKFRSSEGSPTNTP